MKNIPSNILLSRTDSIGDMILALPMAKILKDKYSGIKIYFLGREYTRPVVNACKYCDGFIELNEFLTGKPTIEGKQIETIIHVKPLASVASRAKQLKIKYRIGTTNRIYHWTTCNKLVKLSRKNSDLHEAQLNLKLLKPFGINKTFSYEEITGLYGLENIQPLEFSLRGLIDKNKYNLILHPKSQGNGREWGMENYIELIRLLDKLKYKIFISGIEKERQWLQPLFEATGSDITDICGMMDLEQFIGFINTCDGLVASGTGPLHLAAALGKNAFGVFPPIRPIHAGRWGPIGKNAKAFVVDKTCTDCVKNKMACNCMEEIEPTCIKEALDKSLLKKMNAVQKQINQ